MNKSGYAGRPALIVSTTCCNIEKNIVPQHM